MINARGKLLYSFSRYHYNITAITFLLNILFLYFLRVTNFIRFEISKINKYKFYFVLITHKKITYLHQRFITQYISYVHFAYLCFTKKKKKLYTLEINELLEILMFYTYCFTYIFFFLIICCLLMCTVWIWLFE